MAPHLTPVLVYIVKNTVSPTDLESCAFLRDETNRVGYGFCGVELFVPVQQQDGTDQTPRLFHRVAEPLEDLQSFLCLLYPFVVVAH